MEALQLEATALGQLAVSPRAIAQIAERSLDGCYGVIGLGRVGRIRRALVRRRRRGVQVRTNGRGVELALHVVIAYGLNLSEVAATVRSSVSYEVERLAGLDVERVEVRIDDVAQGD